MKNLKNEKGQSLIEFAIILPLILLILLGILEFGIMLNSYITIHNASREGARLGIVGGTNMEVDALVIKVCPNLAVNELTVNITPEENSRKSGETLTVKVTYNYHVTLPIISAIINEVVVLEGETSMRIE